MLFLFSGGQMPRSWFDRFTLMLALGLIAALVGTAPVMGQDPDPKLENKGTPETVLGYVRDVGCLMRHPDVLKPNNDCAAMCAKVGSPLVVASKNGTLYTPISTSIPDASQRARLMPLVGKYVSVQGRVFERAGMKAIAIEQIEAVPD
jgi:hypothetical protein